MPESVNTYSLQAAATPLEDDGRKTMIEVDHVSMVFNMASEQLNSLKEYAIALFRNELRFKEFRALDDISLDVKEGDVFGILGTNGSGKSTLLKIIAGVLEPSEGTCTVNGNIAPLIELGAGFDMDLTARENVYLNGALLGYPKKFIDEHFDEIVEFAEIEQFLDMPLKNYSSGMVARIAFAIATVIVPEILIVDEVLSVGDFMFQKKCEDRIMSLINEHNVTVLIVSHNNEQIERLCNKAAWIEKGHMRMVGTSNEVCDTYRVLGGHVGSKESETAVFRSLIDKTKPSPAHSDNILADSRYGMAAKFMARCFPDGAETVVLASGEIEMDSLLANSLAGAMDAPLLLFQDAHIPDVTSQELKRLTPPHIVVIGSGESPVEAISAAMPQTIGNTTETRITTIHGDTASELAHKIFEYGLELGIWGNAAVATYAGCVGDLVSLSPYIYDHKCPILLQAQSEPKITQIIRDDFAAGGFSLMFVLSGEHGFPEDELNEYRSKDIQVVRFCEAGPYLANEAINSWIVNAQDTDNSVENILVSSIWHPGDAFGAGVYAAKTHSLILLEDPGDLDSVAHAINYIEAQNGNIERITFIGNHARFSPMDKMLLTKTVARAQNHDARQANGIVDAQ